MMPPEAGPGAGRTIRVVYLAGAGRSGSTLLDCILGSTPGSCSRGELQRLWAVLGNPRSVCGCGDELRACRFWKKVLTCGFGSASEAQIEEYRQLHLAVTGPKNLLRLYSPVKTPAFRSELRRYQELTRRLYTVIADVSGAETIVDSWKGAGYGWVLASLPDVRLSIINLVRDSRAVTNSWVNHRLGTTQPFFLSSLSLAALHWDLEHVVADMLHLRCREYLTLRYEEFANHPGAALERIATTFSVSVPQVDEEATLQLTDHIWWRAIERVT